MEIRKKIQHFLDTKGFFIVLGLCIAAILASAWIMLDSAGLLPWQETEAEPEVLPVQADAPILLFPQEEETAAVSEIPAEKPAAQTPSTQQPVAEPVEAEETVLPQPEEEEIPLPVFQRPLTGEISFGYSGDSLVYHKTMADWRVHEGIDVAAEIGTRVFAAAAGTVTALYEDPLLGTTVVLDHGHDLCSQYSNLASVPVVAVGDTVESGALLGAVGDTAIGESSEVSHLHFAMTCGGELCDPAEYLPQ